MSAAAQLVIAFLLILLQLGIIVALFIMEPPQVGNVCVSVCDGVKVCECVTHLSVRLCMGLFVGLCLCPVLVVCLCV